MPGLRLRLAGVEGGPVVAGDLAVLDHEIEGDIDVSGSGTLVRALLADRLVDELYLFVFPLALGSGGKLFVESGSATKFALAASEAYENGVIHLTYQVAR